MNGLERLYYANGQRLAATELRLEQRYHIDVRRLLTRGLFTAGVVQGLEVTRATARSVTVAAGRPSIVTRGTGSGLSVDGATPKLHWSIAPVTAFWPMCAPLTVTAWFP